jgi:type II secretory pathway predicted ATPase ExeA/phage tail protein X
VYHKFYGLRESPFGLTPDPRFLFASEAHKEALAHIAYGIEERRGFVLVVGEVGTGKTTLIRRVLQRLDPDVKSVFLFNSSLGFDELLEAILRDLEVPHQSRRRVDLIDTLNEFLLQENSAGRRVVLIIDEAQHLSAAVLEHIRMLSNLETARSKLLQIVLVGQPELGLRLGQTNLRQLRQRIGLVAELKPLSRSDTIKYVRHRLAVAGRTEGIFTRLALRAVYRASGGIPRLINVICDKSLVLGYASDKARIGRRIVKQVARDWIVFRAPGGAAPAASSPRRAAERRVRPGRRRAPWGQIAAVAIGSLLATGFLVGRPGAQLASVSLPDGVRSIASSAAGWASEATARALVAVQPPATDVSRDGPPAAAEVTKGPEADAAAPPRLPAAEPPAQPAAESSPHPQAVAMTPEPSPPDEAMAAAPEPSPPGKAVAVTPEPSPPGKAVATATVQPGDTLSWLLYSVYGRADDTVVDLVQIANPGLADIDVLTPGQRLRFPPVEAGAMVHKTDNGRYAVHLLTTSDPTHPRFRKLRAEVRAAGRTIRFVPVRLGTGCETCYRVWIGNFPSRREAEAFYRRVNPEDAA